MLQYQVSVERYKGRKLAHLPRPIEADRRYPDSVGGDDADFVVWDYYDFTSESEANRFYRRINKEA